IITYNQLSVLNIYFIYTERPTPVVIITPDNQVFRGESVTLRCDLQRERGQIISPYTWYKGNSVYPYSSSQEYTISSVTAYDSGEYSCRGTVKGTSRYSHTSTAVKLTVFERPKAVLNIKPGNRVFKGETVTIRCDLQGGGDFEWTYNWSQNSVSSSSTSNQYTISSVTDSHWGDYYCYGTVKGTTRYSDSSAAVRLTVSALPRATLTVDPDSTVFTGESVTLKCEITGYWRWRYQWYKGSSLITTSTDKKHTFTISSAADQDQYWCRGERDYRPRSSQNSTKVILTVRETPKPELTSPLKGAALIGNPVTLYCNLKQSVGWRFDWFKHTQTPESETTTDTHSSYTIRPVSVSDGGQYWCRAGRGDPVYYTNYSDALWVNVTALSPPVTLIVSPSRSQHFTTDSLSLICEEQSNSTGWRVRRYSHSERNVSDCSSGWGSVTGSTCNISSHYTSHTGVYWCESESGGSSSAVNITVHNGPVILESSVHPVTEGDPLTLHCLYRDPKSSDLTADFYKDGLLLQNQTTGEMIIPTVSKSDEGLYHCTIPEKGKSPQSWISVRASPNIPPVVLALGLSLTLFLIIMLCVFCCYKKKKKGNQKDGSVSSVQNQNPGAIPLQAGNDHIYDDVGAKENNNTEDTEANASEITYAQVKFSKKKLKGKDKEATEPSDVTYSLIQMKTLTPCSEDEAIPGPSDANPGPSDVVYSQIQIKPKKPKVKDVKAEPSDVTYAEIDLKDKKNLKENENKLQKDADAGPSDVTYAEIDLKDKKKPKKKPPVPPKGKGCAASNTVYSELKQNLQRPLIFSTDLKLKQKQCHE
uniref:Ig-like domain-containing protein n=1 Tax=Astyanax mexicanus TaxID=7994 RepID=A0A3B1JFL2_ASTMX